MSSVPTYRIHPAVGIARLGDSPDEFCIAPETPGALPIACNQAGNPLAAPDGTPEVRVQTFKDAQGRIKRQAARFQIYVCDDQTPQGRPLRIGDAVSGGGNHGTLVDIQWRVHLANKKAVWFTFEANRGESGYAPGTPRRNADITGSEARQQLIIDPGPQTVNLGTRRQASFSRDGNPMYAVSFPPEDMQPHSIDTLGELLTDDDARLLVLGGHGRSGSCKEGFGHPRIEDYANNDGWFDDIADGPVMARLVMFSREVGRQRFIDVEYPAWVMTAYPRYAPQILDMVTLDDVVEDLSIRDFAYRPDLFGTAGSFDAPQRIDPQDAAALAHWKAGRREWNPDYRPWFWRDVWPILFRADEFTYLTNVLQQSNYPHNQQSRGSFDPYRLGVPPRIAPRASAHKQRRAAMDQASGRLVESALEPALMQLDLTETASAQVNLDDAAQPLREAAAAFALAVCPLAESETGAAFLARWRKTYRENESVPSDDYAAAAAALRKAVDEALSTLGRPTPPSSEGLLKMARVGRPEAEMKRAEEGANPDEPLEQALRRVFGDFRSGKLLERAIDKALADATTDPGAVARQYLYNLLRKPGEENVFQLGGNPASRSYHLPLMPLLAGDNPMNNETASKFLRLTDTQLFILRQWAAGKFINEVQEGFVDAKSVDPWQPYAQLSVGSGRDLDRGVLAAGLGGAFCPGGEIGWIIRNPAIWQGPYRLKADPAFYSFRQTAAQANKNAGTVTIDEAAYTSYAAEDLSQDSDYAVGLQPGDLTKMSALPWQADFNECTTQDIDVTYVRWNALNPDSVNDTLMQNEQRVWETLWWPAHRPLQVYERDSSGNLQYLDWSRGVPQTNAGDLKMVTEWSRLSFVLRNPYAAPGDLDLPSPDIKYIGVERTGG